MNEIEWGDEIGFVNNRPRYYAVGHGNWWEAGRVTSTRSMTLGTYGSRAAARKACEAHFKSKRRRY